MSTTQLPENTRSSKLANAMRLTFGTVAIIHAVLVIAQPILAGMSLEGSTAALDMHYWNGMVIMTVAFVQILAAVLWWKPGGGTSRGVSVSVVLFGLEIAQFLLGDAGSFAIHVPLGILVLAGAVAAAAMAFRNRPEELQEDDEDDLDE